MTLFIVAAGVIHGHDDVSGSGAPPRVGFRAEAAPAKGGNNLRG